MGTDISPGTTLVDGQLVHDADLNALVGDATILATAISSKTLKSEMSLGDELLINDSGTLKKVTGQQVVGISAIPSGCMMDYAGAAEPLGWIFCYGQALSRTTYAALFTAIGTVFGVGDGTTTFNVPDCRGRVTAGKDNMGGTSADRLVGLNGDILGGAGGEEKHVLITAELPSHIHTAPSHVHNNPAHQHYTSAAHQHGIQPHSHTLPGFVMTGAAGGIAAGPGYSLGAQGTNASAYQLTDGAASGWSDAGYGATTSDAGTSVQDTTATGSGTAHNVMQPTIIFNKIIKT